MSEQTMERFRKKQITAAPGHRGQSSFDEDARTPLTILLVVTGTVLLIACANIANLLLVRGAGRAAEMAVRLSIGASRRQLITQLLTESIMLAAFGAIAGLLVAKWTLDVIASFIPADEASMVAFALSPTMLMFAGAAAIVTGIAFGLFPALHSTRPDLAVDPEEPGRAARRREGGAALPHHARHRADRDVDGAARARGPVRQEPVQRQPRRSRFEDRPHGALQPRAGAELLQHRANPAAVRAHRR